MDVFGLLSVPDILVWILLFVTVLYVYGTWPFKSLAEYGYKGPKPKPFIGNMDLVFKNGHFGAWDLTGKKLYGSVYSMYEGRQPTLVVFDTDILKQVLVKDFSNFADRREMYLRGNVISHSLLDIAGAEWKRIRGLTSPFFSTGKLKKNTENLDMCLKLLHQRCERFADKGEEFDVKEVTGAFTLEAICLTAFGLKIDSQSDPNHVLLETVKKMGDINLNYWAFWVGFAFPFLLPYFDRLGCEMWPEGCVDTLVQFTNLAIEDRLKSEVERPDFIQTMIKAHDAENEMVSDGSPDPDRGKALNDKEIAAQVALFVLAGYDTVSTTLSFLLFNLASNQGCQDRVSCEIKDEIGDKEITYDNLKRLTYLDMCLEESQRLYPAIFRNDRKCLQDTTINGYFIPKDTLIIIPIYGLHRDPDLWNDPVRFDPERFSEANRPSLNPYAYHAFGHGPRNCVGMRLAQIEVKMAAIQILRNFKVSVGKKTQLPIKLDATFFPRPIGGMWLKLDRRVA